MMVTDNGSPNGESPYTKVPNVILENLVQLRVSPNCWRVLMFIIRKTWGYHKDIDYIANRQIVEGTQLCKAVVSRSLRLLETRKLITRNGKFVGIQMKCDLWGKLAKSSTVELCDAEKVDDNVNSELAKSSTELSIPSTKVSSGSVTQKKKDKHSKENNKESVNIPGFINVEVWEAFVEMRVKCYKQPLTEYATNLIFSKLENLKLSGDDPNEVLNESIMNSWKGVFALKNHGGNGHGGIHGQVVTEDEKPTGITIIE